MKVRRFATNFMPLLTGLLLFIAMQPFWIWHAPEYLKLLLLVLPIVPMFLNNNIKGNLLMFSIFLVILLFNVIFHGYGFFFAIFMTVFVFVPFCKEDYGLATFHVFRKVLAICFAISIVQWFCFFLGYSMSSFIIEPLNEVKDYNYYAFPPLLVVPNIFFNIRYASAFDEPGVVGSICLLILFIENYNLKNVYNIIILLAGLCSFSMFFIGGSLIYLLIRYGIKPLYLFFFAFAFLMFYEATKDNPILDELVYARFEYDESKEQIAGLNRSNKELDDYFDSIVGSSSFYFGVDSNTRDQFAGSYGYKNAILQFGFIVVSLYVLFFIAYAYKKTKGINFLLFCALLLMTLYQRPNLFDVVYVFMFSQFVNAHKEEFSHKLSTRHVRKRF